MRALENTRPNAVIRYEKVSGASIFSVTSSGSNAGEISLTGTVDAEAVDSYAVTVRVCCREGAISNINHCRIAKFWCFMSEPLGTDPCLGIDIMSRYFQWSEQ